MAVTQGQVSVLNFADQTTRQIDGVTVTNAGAAPASGKALRQGVCIGDPNDNTQFQSVDSDGNARVIVGRVATASDSNVPAATASTTILATRAARVGACIWNQSSGTLYLKPNSGVTAGPTGNATWVVPPGGFWSLAVVAPGYTGPIYGIWDSIDGGANVSDF